MVKIVMLEFSETYGKLWTVERIYLFTLIIMIETHMSVTVETINKIRNLLMSDILVYLWSYIETAVSDHK